MRDKVKGKYEEVIEDTIYLRVLFTDDQTELYNKILNSIDKSAFLDLKRLAAGYKKIGLATIGDNVTDEGMTDYNASELSLQIICTEPDKKQKQLLSQNSTWKFAFTNSNSEKIRNFIIFIDKSSGFILDRQYDEKKRNTKTDS